MPYLHFTVRMYPVVTISLCRLRPTHWYKPACLSSTLVIRSRTPDVSTRTFGSSVGSICFPLARNFHVIIGVGLPENRQIKDTDLPTTPMLLFGEPPDTTRVGCSRFVPVTWEIITSYYHKISNFCSETATAVKPIYIEHWWLHRKLFNVERCSIW